MLVVLALAGLAVLGTVVVLAMGRGGELARVHPDHPPLALPAGRPIGGTDAALLQLPRTLWGYHVEITDEALRRLAYALTERDARVAVLEQQLAELRRSQGEAGERLPMWDDAAETPWETAAPDEADDYAGRHAGPLRDPEDHPGEEVR